MNLIFHSVARSDVKSGTTQAGNGDNNFWMDTICIALFGQDNLDTCARLNK
jgi:hypothetical protein